MRRLLRWLLGQHPEPLPLRLPQWCPFCHTDDDHIQRAELPGGWLYLRCARCGRWWEVGPELRAS